MLLLRLYNREAAFPFGYVTVNGMNSNVYSSDSDAASIVSSKVSGSSASSSASASLISTSEALSEDFSESFVSAVSSDSLLSVPSVAECSPVCSQDWKSSAGSCSSLAVSFSSVRSKSSKSSSKSKSSLQDPFFAIRAATAPAAAVSEPAYQQSHLLSHMQLFPWKK